MEHLRGAIRLAVVDEDLGARRDVRDQLRAVNKLRIDQNDIAFRLARR